jgi:hypothetical protein
MISFAEKRLPAQPQGLQEQLADHLFVRPAGDPLDHEAGQPERRVVVRDHRSEGRDLLDRRHASHVPVERVVALAGLLEQIAVPARRVVEQVQDRDVRRHRLVPQPEVRDVGPDRRIQVDPSLFDEDHDRGGRVGLARRADLEQRSWVDLERVLHARDAVEGGVLLAVEHDTDRDAGNLEPVGQQCDLGPQVGVGLHDPPSRRTEGGTVPPDPSHPNDVPGQRADHRLRW